MSAPSTSVGSAEPLGVALHRDGANVAVFGRNATRIDFCLFDETGERETARIPLAHRTGDVHHAFVAGIAEGQRYGLRADGAFEPAKGHRYDPAKLLLDPYAKRLDRPFRYVPELAAPRAANLDTAPFVPRCIATAGIDPAGARLPQGHPPRLIYEVAVKAFGMHHPGLRVPLRGTLAALAEPAAIAHLQKLGVSHVELMPIAAWIDERHLPTLHLSNAWGYNPVIFMAPDPRLAPGGIEELRDTVARLHEAGIAVILDVVFNHTGESDAEGPTLCLRGLDNAVYYRHAADDPGRLVNDTACGNTLACDRAPVVRLVMDAMRHWVEAAGIDGFRFDLGTVLGREPEGYSAEAPLITAIRQDPLLRQAQLIAEPWDPGPGGYRLGAFPTPFLEWNDKYRDDVRRFWRNDAATAGGLATRLAGSSDIFEAGRRTPGASVNYLASHDGFTLADLVSYAGKHNEANGEGNRDGSNDNHSWNNGAEGDTADEAVREARACDRRALLATLFLSRGTPMLTAGDELGRSQQGNNNAYCQDNETTWIDWAKADWPLADFVAGLMRFRNEHPVLQQEAFFSGRPAREGGEPDVVWLAPSGQVMQDADWERADMIGMLMTSVTSERSGERLCIVVNRATSSVTFDLPQIAAAGWSRILDSAQAAFEARPVEASGRAQIAARSVAAFAPVAMRE